ncbi:MAG: CsgG/HfaB family protein [Lutibacter sp.]|nr:CsgG/HfaB family protein [Lutibacter sp.]
MLNYRYIYTIPLFLLLTSCGAFFNQPYKQERARIGETTPVTHKLKEFPLPQEPVVAAVYNFKDQTGQYKAVESGSTFSTAVSQGATTMLNKALEDSKWFTVIERENLSNLLNERNIIRSTRDEYTKNKNTSTNSPNLPALLFAGVLLEGGVISYDTNIITGGAGARYLGIGSSTQYRQDRITVYLRAVSTSTGKILKTVYISKTILSQALSANLFKYVKYQRLLESEIGFTKNEPVQLAMKEAIDKAVENLIIEGIIDGLWMPQGGQPTADLIKEAYLKEEADAESTVLLERKLEDRRGQFAISFSGGTALMDGDYPNPKATISTNSSLKIFFKKPNFNLNVDMGYLKLENKQSFKDQFLTTNVSLEYNVLPYDNFTPFIYGGVGAISSSSHINKAFAKIQYGVGFEYLPVNNIGIKLFGEQNLVLSDKLDGINNGKRDDYFWRFGVGLNFYIGKPHESVKSAIYK